MKSKFYAYLLMAVFYALTVSSLAGQTTLTTLPNPPYNGGNSLTSPSQVSFVLRNNNATGVRLTSIGNWCTTAENNSVWQLYYTATALSGSATNVTAAPWTLVATSLPTSVPSTGIRTLNFSGLNFVIPGGAQYRFALRNTGPGSCRYSGTGAALSPNTFSGGGVDLLVGNVQIAGLNVGYSGSGTGLTLTPRYFTGFVTFTPATQPCAENFDGTAAPALPAGWSASSLVANGSSTPWATNTTNPNSSPNSAFTNNPASVSDEALNSRIFAIVSPTAQLSFRNNYDLENIFDGMVLEISIGGGPFTDILAAGGSFVTGGYNGALSNCCSNPLSGQQAWTGNSGGWITTTVNLPAAANGQNVVFRWRRGTDASVSGAGVRIDDITLTGSDCPGACVVTCPGNIIVNNTPNQCGAIVNFPAPATNGACGPVTTNPASGSFFPVGTTTVTASTFAGPQCTFTVRVNDVQPPSITCPANITTGNTPGQCGAVVNFTPAATDNCPGVTVSSVPASGSVFPIGTTTVNVTATDAAGNTATCSFTVTVSDTENPTFSSPGLFPERLYYKFDGSGTTVPNLATAPPAGTATATLVGLTQGSAGKCGGALVGTGATNQSLNTNWATNMAAPWTISFWLGAGQVDNNPSYLFGDVTAGSFRGFYGGAALGNNMLVRGGSGDILITGVNPAATFVTIVYNGTNTVVYKNGASPQTYNVTFANSGPGPFRVGGYSTLASMNGTMDEFSLYTRALTPAEVLNIYNNCPVNVNNCPSNITVGSAPGVCGAVVNYTTPVAIDNCPGVTTTQTAGLPAGSTFPVGTTVNTFTATDAAGNTATCTFNVTVNDIQAPSITCPSNITVSTPIGSCTAIVNYTVTATDNCPGVTTTRISGPASGSAFPLGTTTISWRATDASGNISNCTFTVTVNDGQLPVISQQPVTKYFCEGSDATFTVVSTNAQSYQWQQWNGSAWVNIAGATGATLTISNVTAALNTNTYRVQVLGLCTTIISTTATLYVNPLPSVSLVTSIPPSLLPAQSLNISSSVSPGGGTYVWRKDGVVLAGATTSSLTGLTVDDIGTYNVTYTDPNGCTRTSSNVVVSGQPFDKLYVYPNPNNGQFQARFYNQVNEQATVRVYDSKGARVYERTVVTNLAYTRIDIDLGAVVSSGVYTVELIDSGGKRVGAKKIVVRQRP